MSAPATATGSWQALRICCSAPSSSPSPKISQGAGASRAANAGLCARASRVRPRDLLRLQPRTSPITQAPVAVRARTRPPRGRWRSAAGHRGRPRSLALDSAEPVASAGGIRVSQSASLRAPPGKSEPAAPGWCIRPSALLACSLAQASPDARRLPQSTAADGAGCLARPATVGQRRSVSSQTCSQALGTSRVERDHARGSDRATPAASGRRRPESSGLPRSRPESGERGARTGPPPRRRRRPRVFRLRASRYGETSEDQRYAALRPAAAASRSRRTRRRRSTPSAR